MSNYPLTDPSASIERSQQEKDPPRGISDLGLQRGLTNTETGTEWRLSTFAGRFGEVSSDIAGATLTLLFRLVLEAQKQAEPVAWITGRESTFFPPDVADVGIDLSALAVIWAPDTIGGARAADHLLRSGAFGLVVIDIGARGHLPLHVQSRLAAQARQYGTALLCITEKESTRPTLGSLVSLRVHTKRTRRKEDRFRCEVQVMKDKRRGPGWGHVEVYHGPDGLS